MHRINQLNGNDQLDYRNRTHIKHIFNRGRVAAAGMTAVAMLLALPVHASAANGSDLNSGFAGVNLDPARGDLFGQELSEQELLQLGRASLGQGGAASIFSLQAEYSTPGQTAGNALSAQNAEGETAADQEQETESEYAKLAIAHVDKYVNIRSMPSTDGKILGKIYNGAVAHIIETAGEENDWFHVTSGSVEGYIKAEYLFYGEDAVAVIDDYVTRYAVIKATRLNVRKDTTTDSKRIGYLDQGERAKLVEDLGEWLKVEYSQGQTGYVSAEYVEITEEFTYAISIEEEQAEIARQKALEERRKQEEEKKAREAAAALAAQQAQAAQDGQVTPQSTEAPAVAQEIAPAGDYSTTQELRDSLVEYALQFVGNPYVNGGNSLTGGTDCSGFTKLIYGEYGYSLGRTPASQLSSAGRSVDYSEIQKGDIICYSSNGGKSCTHVAIYIGDEMIVHAANSRKGISTQKAQYGTIIGVKNVID